MQQVLYAVSVQPNMDTRDVLEDLVEAIENLMAVILTQRGEPTIGDETLPQTARLALRLIVDRGPLRPNVLADHMATTRATATRTVATLRSAGLAQTEADPSDGRSILVSATKAGRRLANERHRRLARVISAAVDGMSLEDQERLTTLLHRLPPVLAERG
jgi:DNA-binding MarR family transcriptional regulator